MLTNYPASIIVHGLGLNITVQSYDQSLDFGLMADAQAMPDVRELADAIAIAFDDLCLLPRPGETDPETAVEGMVSKARRRLTGAVSGAVSGAAKKMMDTAVDAAVTQVTGRGRPGAAAKRRRAA
jgi:hypothetical protein